MEPRASGAPEEPGPFVVFPILERSTPHALIDTAMDVVEICILDTSAAAMTVFMVLDFARTDYKADVLDLHQSALAARLAGLAHVEVLRSMVRERR